VNKLKTKFHKNEAINEKDVEDTEDDYVPIKFDDTLGKKKPSQLSSKLRLSLNSIASSSSKKSSVTPSSKAVKLSSFNFKQNFDFKESSAKSSSSNSSMKITNYIQEFLSKQMVSDIKNLKEKNNVILNEVNSLFENAKVKSNEKKQLEVEFLAQKKHLSEIKEQRNKLIAETHLLNNELDYIKSEAKLYKEEKVKTASQPGNDYSDYDTQQDNQAILASFDRIIEELEDKISNLSVASVATKEQLENIYSDLKQNEHANKQLKNEISKQDKLIDELIKEKSNLLKNNKSFQKDNSVHHISRDDKQTIKK